MTPSRPPIGRFGSWLEQEIRRQERWPVLVAGSVVAGEEDAVLAAYDLVQRQWRHTLLILAPRKPAQFDAAAEIVASRRLESRAPQPARLSPRPSMTTPTSCSSIPSAN